MREDIKNRIEQISRGEVPDGYKKGKLGVVPKEWNETYFSNLFTNLSEYTDDLEKYPLYSLTIEDGVTPKTERYERSHLVKKEDSYKIIPPNYYAYNPMNIKLGTVSRHKGNKPVAISGYYDIFTTVYKDDLEFMDYFLKYGAMLSYYKSVATGSLIEKQRVHYSQFINFSFYLPEIEERKKIAEILSTQDKIIELKQNLIEQKKLQKKYLMENLLTGKTRLKGFSEKWKSIKLSELGETYSGLSGKSKEDFGTGKAYIPYMNIFSHSVIDKDELEYVEIYPEEKQAKVKFGDVFFTVSSETPDEVGMSSVLLDNLDEVYLNSFCFGFRLNDFNTLLPIFASHYFRGKAFRKILNKLAQGATRYNLSKNNLLKTIITLPSLPEQQAIAQILSTADKEIELLQQELEQEKLKKKSLSQLLLTGIVRV